MSANPDRHLRAESTGPYVSHGPLVISITRALNRSEPCGSTHIHKRVISWNCRSFNLREVVRHVWSGTGRVAHGIKPLLTGNVKRTFSASNAVNIARRPSATARPAISRIQVQRTQACHRAFDRMRGAMQGDSQYRARRGKHRRSRALIYSIAPCMQQLDHRISCHYS